MNIIYTDQEIIDAYEKGGGVWKAAEILGTYGQKVHRRLKKIGYPINKINYFTEEEIEKIKAHYGLHVGKRSLNLKEFSASLNRNHTDVCTIAKKLGLTNYDREMQQKQKDSFSHMKKEWHKSNPHPRGMLGKKHSPKTLKRLSEASTEKYKNLTKKQKNEWIFKILKTKSERGNLINQRQSTTWKSQWLELDGKRFFTRSSWEYNYVHILNERKISGLIIDWEYEATDFWFDKVRTNPRCYVPDFKVTLSDGSIEYHEVKGWMDKKSQMKLDRMAKYYPDIKIVLIRSKEYKQLMRGRI